MSSLIKTNASGELGLHARPHPQTHDTAQAKPRKSRWPARLDVLQSATGFILAVFLMAHMFFVSTILISQQAFYTVARFFEGAYFFARPYPALVSCVVAVVIALFIGHAGLAMRKLPAGFASSMPSAGTKTGFNTAIPRYGGYRHGPGLRCSSWPPSTFTTC